MTNEVYYQTVIKEEVLSRAADMSQQGYRLAQMHCTTLKDQALPYEVNYSFAKDLELYNLRVVLGEQEILPSISEIHPAAFLYENEIHDLFGVKVENMSIDYDGRLYTTTVPTPFRNSGDEGGKNNG